MQKNAKFGILIAIILAISGCFGIDPSPSDGENGKVENTETVETTTTQQQITTMQEEKPAQEAKFIGLKNFLPTHNLGYALDYPPFFTVSFSENHRQAEWVAYELTRENMMNSGEERPSGFFPDGRVKAEYRVLHGDYTNSGFDRGHLAAAADFGWSEEGIEATFVTTNISPQTPEFNRGIWKSLESSVRGWAVQFEQLYVVTGAILTERAQKRFPNEKRYIAVPRRYYKVLLNYVDEQPIAIGFIMENKASSEPMGKFAVSIDEIETLTGIDFFPELPDELEGRLESKFDLKDWGL